MPDQRTNYDNIAEAVAALSAKPFVQEINEVPHLFRPAGFVVENLEKLLPGPTRAKGFATLADTDSFVGYVTDLTTPSTRIYCEVDYQKGHAKFAAIFNDDINPESDLPQPGWKDNGAWYTMPQSIEWGRWISMNRKPMSQVDFAQFIEENMRDIVSGQPGEPSGADMLSMALSMEATQDQRLKSTVKLQSGGVELLYVNKENEETADRMRVFDRFTLGIAPFWNGPAYKVQSRLRYRAKDGAVTFWYELWRPDLTIADAVKAAIATIAEQTNLPVLFGKAY